MRAALETTGTVMRIVSVETAEVFVPEGRRPLEKDKIMSLANSMAVLGLVQPITVSYKGSRIRLVAGHGRLALVITLIVLFPQFPTTRGTFVPSFGRNWGTRLTEASPAGRA